MADQKTETSAKLTIGNFFSGMFQNIAHAAAGTVPITLVPMTVNTQKSLAIKFANAAALDDFVKNMPAVKWEQFVRTAQEQAIHIPATYALGSWTLTFPNSATAKAFCAACKFDETMQVNVHESEVIMNSLHLKSSPDLSQHIECSLKYPEPRPSYALTFPDRTRPEMNGLLIEPEILQNILYFAVKKTESFSFPFAQLVMYAHVNKAFYHAAMAIYDKVCQIKLTDAQSFKMENHLRSHYIHQLGFSTKLIDTADPIGVSKGSPLRSYLDSLAFKFMMLEEPQKNSIAGAITFEAIAAQISKLFGESRRKDIAPFPVVMLEETLSAQHFKSATPAMLLVIDFKDGRFATDLHCKLFDRLPNNQVLSCDQPPRTHRVIDDMGQEQQFVTTASLMMLGAKKIQEFLKFCGFMDYSIDHFMQVHDTKITPLSIAFRAEQHLGTTINNIAIHAKDGTLPAHIKIFSDDAHKVLVAMKKLMTVDVAPIHMEKNCLTLNGPAEIFLFLSEVCRFHRKEMVAFLKANQIVAETPQTTASATIPRI